MRIASETRPRVPIRLLLVGWMVLIFALSSRSHLPRLADMPPELVAVMGHFTVYAVLAALIWAALPSHGWPLWRRLALALAGAIVYGVSDEWHQSFVPGRDPAVFDLAVDALGACCALIAVGLAVRTCDAMAQ
jgi:VanZ family protein